MKLSLFQKSLKYYLKLHILKLANMLKGDDPMSKITMATATEMQNNFGKYLNLIISGQQIIVTKNGQMDINGFTDMPADAHRWFPHPQHRGQSKMCCLKGSE